jgi:hypothetical protein
MTHIKPLKETLECSCLLIHPADQSEYSHFEPRVKLEVANSRLAFTNDIIKQTVRMIFLSLANESEVNVNRLLFRLTVDRSIER